MPGCWNGKVGKASDSHFALCLVDRSGEMLPSRKVHLRRPKLLPWRLEWSSPGFGAFRPWGSVGALVEPDSARAGGAGARQNLDAAGFRSRPVGEVPSSVPRTLCPKSYRKAVKVMARDIELAVAAAKLAVGTPGW